VFCSIVTCDCSASLADNDDIQLIQDALQSIGPGRTVISVAHVSGHPSNLVSRLSDTSIQRLSTIRRCDAIFVFVDGRIEETGTHQQLIGLNGHYKKLVR
jgi:ABC-type multidrug transport system fused ATPase/permease subunit